MNQETRIDLTNCRPLDDRILLLRLPDLETPSMLIIPDVAQQPSHRGKAVRLGPGKRFEDGGRRRMAVNLDDIVHYMSCDVDDGKHVLIQEGDILGIEDLSMPLDAFAEKYVKPAFGKDLSGNVESV